MNNISKLGLIMYFLSFLIVIILILLQQKIPNLVMYLFTVGLILNFVGVIRQIRKNNQL